MATSRIQSLDESLLASAAAALRDARRVVVLTGAGVSAESGVPTFRDAMTGLWARYDPAQLATPEAFARDPALVARWYDERRLRCAAIAPNPGHVALAQAERAMATLGRSFTLITQNVDRLHQAAGSAAPIELHGSIWVWRCVLCGEEREERGGAFERQPPLCRCGGMRRPGVVWFGEMLPRAALEAAQRATGECDLFIAAGTSAQVYPAAGLIHAAIAAGARTIEVNPETTPNSEVVDWALPGKSGEILPRLVEKAFATTPER